MVSVLLRSVGTGYTTQVTTAYHSLVADEPEPYGDNLGPSPYELLLSSLGACTSMTLLMYARRHSWPLEQVQVELTHERVHAQDSASYDSPGTRIERIRRRIHLVGELSIEQRERLLEIAQKCPVHKTLSASPEIVDEFGENEL